MALIITFVNDGSGTAAVGNYDVTIYINTTPIARARLDGHVRAEPWTTLLRKLVEQEEKAS